MSNENIRMSPFIPKGIIGIRGKGIETTHTSPLLGSPSKLSRQFNNLPKGSYFYTAEIDNQSNDGALNY